MQVQVDIEFDQLVEVVKSLPASQLKQLKIEIEKNTRLKKNQKGLENLLLNGPVATKTQLKVIENNRKAINKWRTD